jgi:hypothetical protein
MGGYAGRPAVNLGGTLSIKEALLRVQTGGCATFQSRWLELMWECQKLNPYHVSTRMPIYVFLRLS